MPLFRSMPGVTRHLVVPSNLTQQVARMGHGNLHFGTTLLLTAVLHPALHYWTTRTSMPPRLLPLLGWAMSTLPLTAQQRQGKKWTQYPQLFGQCLRLWHCVLSFWGDTRAAGHSFLTVEPQHRRRAHNGHWFVADSSQRNDGAMPTLTCPLFPLRVGQRMMSIRPHQKAYRTSVCVKGQRSGNLGFVTGQWSRLTLSRPLYSIRQDVFAANGDQSLSESEFSFARCHLFRK
jgi:hypothetical protein